MAKETNTGIVMEGTLDERGAETMAVLAEIAAMDVALAVVIDDEIVKATMMTVTMACDHRAMDGAIGAQFLGILKEIIEHPLQLLV